MSNLYELLDEYKHIEQELIDSGGELTPELEERIAINKDELEAKIDAYCRIIRQRQGQNDAIVSELERLAQLSKSNNGVIDRLKGAILQALTAYAPEDKKGIRHVRTELFNVATRKSHAVLITDVEKIPKQFVEYRAYTQVDKNAIKKILKEGHPVAGTELQENISVQIK